MGDPNEVVCKYERMGEWRSTLENISQTMGTLSNIASACRQIFMDAYEGDAFAEVDLFFESLTEHLIRLGGLYAKMAEFINMTNESFSGSDIKMTKNMGD